MTPRFDVTPHLDDLWRYARVLARDDGDADDLVQEALVRALGFAKSFDQSRPLLPWLIRIVRDTFLSGVMRARAERDWQASLSPLANRVSPADQVHSAELADVARILRTIPTEQAEVLHLVAVLGFSYAETADVLDVPPGTVMSRLSRARTALRAAIDDPPERSAQEPMLRLVGGSAHD